MSNRVIFAQLTLEVTRLHRNSAGQSLLHQSELRLKIDSMLGGPFIMAPEEIKQILEQAFDGADVAADGDGSHFKVRLVSETFDGLRPVKKQQMVYQVLNDHIKSGAIHALSIETYTPQEWEKASKLQLG
ncbi:BolA family protein [Pleionea mediterranea]|nr:BolA family protein [Pleionea mediterranea]